MFTRKETLFVVIFLLIAALIIFRPQNRDRVEALMPTGGIEVYTRAFQQEGLVAPFDCEVFVRAVGGSAGATSALGIGTTPANFRPLLTGLPQEITDEVAELGEFREGDAIPFAIKTTWGDVWYAFIGRRDEESLGAFTDTDGSLERSGEQVIELVGDRFLMRLDDAASFAFDDNDGDLLVELWFEHWKP